MVLRSAPSVLSTEGKIHKGVRWWSPPFGIRRELTCLLAFRCDETILKPSIITLVEKGSYKGYWWKIVTQIVISMYRFNLTRTCRKQCKIHMFELCQNKWFRICVVKKPEGAIIQLRKLNVQCQKHISLFSKVIVKETLLTSLES